MARAIEDRRDSFAEGWRPQLSEKLVGEIVSLDERMSGHRSTTSSHTRSSSCRRRTDANWPGTRSTLLPGPNSRGSDLALAIAYHGKPEGKNYERWRVIVKRDAEDQPEPAWDRIGAEAEAEIQQHVTDAGFPAVTTDDEEVSL